MELYGALIDLIFNESIGTLQGSKELWIKMLCISFQHGPPSHAGEVAELGSRTTVLPSAGSQCEDPRILLASPKTPFRLTEVKEAPVRVTEIPPNRRLDST